MTLPRVQPIAPTWRKEPFDDPDWLFDFKFDGFRALCYIEQRRNRLISRNNNIMARFDALADQVAATLIRAVRRRGNPIHFSGDERPSVLRRRDCARLLRYRGEARRRAV
jgi:hypothetical protein